MSRHCCLIDLQEKHVPRPHRGSAGSSRFQSRVRRGVHEPRLPGATVQFPRLRVPDDHRRSGVLLRLRRRCPSTPSTSCPRRSSGCGASTSASCSGSSSSSSCGSGRPSTSTTPIAGLDPPQPRIKARLEKGVRHDSLLADRQYGNPTHQHRGLRHLRRRHPRHRHRRDPPEVQGVGLLHRRRRRSPGARTAWPSPATTCRPPPSSGVTGAIAIYGYDGLLYSVGFFVAWIAGAVPGRRAAAQHRQVHDGRRAQLPDEPEAGPHRRRHVDARHLVRVPARPDGRRGRPRRPAPGRLRPEHAEPRDRARGRCSWSSTCSSAA